MPRRGRPRTIGSEESLARRIEHERERRGWSPASLAERMTAIGCPMSQASIWKIEHGQPRRRITVDELVALANVFQLTVPELLIDSDIAASAAAASQLRHIGELVGEYAALNREINEAWGELATMIGEEARQRLMPTSAWSTNFDDLFGPGMTVAEIVSAAEEAVRPVPRDDGGER